MALCCSGGNQSIKGEEVIETFNKIQVPKKGKYGKLFSIGGGAYEPHKYLNNVRAGIMPVPTSSKDCDRMTSGDYKNFAQRQIRKSNYEDLLLKFKGKNQKWTDPDFPPESKSWGVPGCQANWKRAPEIIKNPQFVSDNFSPGDILQGRLGNCYFLSAIAGIAQRPYRIKKLFPSMAMNQNGIYMARVLFKGVYQEVVVDDTFPCSSNGQWLGAQPAGGKEIWVMILQKCWAKLHGSYDAIDGGLPNEVLHAFSGAPTNNYSIASHRNKLDILFAHMIEADKKDEIVCCGTEPQNCQGKLNKVGLVGGHAYTVLGVYEQPVRMLKIRNPWGDVEWKGTASDGDDSFWNRVSPEEQLNMGYSNKKDGTFFMLYEDFDNFFVIVDICHIDDNANYFYQEICFKQAVPQLFDFYTAGGNLTFALSQESKRQLKSKGKPQKLGQATIVLGRKTGKDNYEYVQSKYTTSTNHLYLPLKDLPQGDYGIGCFLDTKEKEHYGTVSVYSGVNMALTGTDGCPQNFLNKCFLDHARKNQEGKQMLSYEPEQWVAFDILADSCAIGYSAFHVCSSSTRKLGLQFNEQQYLDNGLELLAPYRDAGKFKLVCAQGNEMIVLCRLQPNSFFKEFTMPVPKMCRLR